MTPTTTHIRGIILISLAAISFSLLPIFFSVLSQNQIGLGVQVLTRTSIGVISLFIWNFILIQRNRNRASFNSLHFILFLINGLILLLAFSTYNFAIGLGTSPAKAILLIYLNPIYIAILGWAILREKLSFIKILAILCGVVGIFIAMGFWNVKDLYTFRFSDLLAFINGILAALIIIIGRKSGSLKHISPSLALMYSLSFALIWALVFSGIIRTFELNIIDLWEFPLNIKSLFLLLAIGLFGTSMPFIFLYSGLHYLEASVAGLIMLLEPVSVFALQAIFLGQPIFWWQILGGSILLISGYLIQAEAKKVPN